MIKVYQTKIGHKRGDCFNACLASILEVEINKLPKLRPLGNWLKEYQKFLKPFNLGITYCTPTGSNKRMYGYAIADRERANKSCTHGVVYYNGKKVHDPFPENIPSSKLGKINMWYVITVLDPTKPIKLLNEHQK